MGWDQLPLGLLELLGGERAPVVVHQRALPVVVRRDVGVGNLLKQHILQTKEIT